ncbi:MAG TPA: hypothetical protein VLI05_05820 [Candidatus Saccharimonadia bacterium]|nr:hypothetical protein [Candidatus Saccharimonadia bacterium]
MQPIPELKYVGLYAVLLALVCISGMIWKWRGDRTMTISRHAAAHPQATLVFGFSITVTGLMFYAFLWFWFVPALGLPMLFSWLVSAAGIGQALAAWIPDRPGLESRIHNIGAFAMAIIMVPLAFLIARAPQASAAAHWAAVAFLLVAAIYATLFFLVPRAKSYYLAYQSSYFGGFLLVILIAAYTTYPA